MPYSIKRNGNMYAVVNSDTGKVHARHTTKAKAEAQMRLLYSKEGQQPKQRVKVKKLSNGQTVRIHFKGA